MNLPTLIAAGIGLCMCLSSCYPKHEVGEVQAWVPVYMSVTDAKNQVSISTAQTTERSGKIYAFGNYIFQNDINKGIHIIDNTDRLHPQKVAFLNIPFNTEFAVKGNYIYANNGTDLVVIDIQDIMKPAVVKRLENAFPNISQNYPPQPGYFVCADLQKGIVVDWVLQTVTNPPCRN